MRFPKQASLPVKHRDLLLYVISKSGPAKPNAIFARTQRIIASLGNQIYPLNFPQFRNQLQSLIRKGLITRNGFALQVTEKGYRHTLYH